MKYQIPGWEVNPATILTFKRYNKTIEKMKKCEPNLSLLQENGRMAVNRMRVVNGSAEHEHIRTHLDGIPASEIEKKLCVRSPWHLAMTSFYDYPQSADPDESRFLEEIVFHVDVEHGLHPCPVCGNLCKVKEYEVRKYYHTRTLDCKTAIIAKVPKLYCPADGYPQLRVPWARARSSYTLFFERAVITELLEERTVNSVSRMLGTTNSIVGTIVEYRIGVTLQRMDLSHVHTIYIDESSWKVGHKYVTLVYDQCRRLIFACEGKDSGTVTLLKDWLILHKGDPEKITNVSCDMGLAYPKGVRLNFPNAVITYDKFHVIKLVTEAFNEVLDRQNQEDRNIKWFRKRAFHSRSLSETDEKRLNTITDDYREIGHNYRLLMVISKIYDYGDKQMADFYFDLWYEDVGRYGAPEMKRAADSLMNRKEDILRWYDSRINNGIVEGMNTQFKLLIRRARGFTNVNHLIAMSYLLFSQLPLFYDSQELVCLNVEPSESEASS